MQYFDRHGNKIDEAAWIRLRFEDPQYFRVALDTFATFEVSTVWIGVVVTFDGGGPGDDSAFGAFETMVFPGDSQVKYATEAEASVGHVVVCLRELMERGTS